MLDAVGILLQAVQSTRKNRKVDLFHVGAGKQLDVGGAERNLAGDLEHPPHHTVADASISLELEHWFKMTRGAQSSAITGREGGPAVLGQNAGSGMRAIGALADFRVFNFGDLQPARADRAVSYLGNLMHHDMSDQGLSEEKAEDFAQAVEAEDLARQAAGDGLGDEIFGVRDAQIETLGADLALQGSFDVLVDRFPS